MKGNVWGLLGRVSGERTNEKKKRGKTRKTTKKIEKIALDDIVSRETDESVRAIRECARVCT